MFAAPEARPEGPEAILPYPMKRPNLHLLITRLTMLITRLTMLITRAGKPIFPSCDQIAGWEYGQAGLG